MNTPSTLRNVIDALQDFAKCKAQFAAGSKRIQIRHTQNGPWSDITYDDYLVLRLRLEHLDFAPVSKTRIEECVRYVALQNGDAK
jgi:hypothetical protein